MRDPYRFVAPKLDSVHRTVDAKVVPHSIPAKVAAAALSKTDHSIETIERIDKVRYIDVSSESIMDLIRKLNSAELLLRMVLDKSVDRVVMGPKVYRQLLSDSASLDSPVCVNVQSTFGYRGNLFVSGFLVQMIPWYDSDDILIVPVSEIKRPSEISSRDLEEKQRQIDFLTDENHRLRQAVQRSIFEKAGVKEVAQ